MWHLYGVKFRLRTSLHVGYAKVGNLQRTRPYIPARTLRGAIVARLADRWGFGDHATIDRFAGQHLLCGYIFPTRGGLARIQPYCGDRELGYMAGGTWLTVPEFDRTFLTAATSTALERAGKTALDGSLHEIECLGPVTNEGNRIWLSGWLYINDSAATAGPYGVFPDDHDVAMSNGATTISLRRDVLDGIQVGGERRYGFGRLTCERVDRSPFPGYDGSGTWPTWSVEAGDPFHAHADIDSCPDVHGVVEPLVGRITVDAASFGTVLTPAQPCWIPGSRPRSPGRYEVRGDGILFGPG